MKDGERSHGYLALACPGARHRGLGAAQVRRSKGLARRDLRAVRLLPGHQHARPRDPHPPNCHPPRPHGPGLTPAPEEVIITTEPKHYPDADLQEVASRHDS